MSAGASAGTSNQVIVLANEDFRFEVLEVLEDTAGNSGTVIGQNSVAVGVKMEPNTSFDVSRDISTTGRLVYNDVGAVIADNNFTLTEFNAVTEVGDIFTISALNDSSPGALYANTGVLTDVKVEELDNITAQETPQAADGVAAEDPMMDPAGAAV